jgi:hypothetical protein
MPDDAGFTLEDARARLLIRDADLPRTARDVAQLIAHTGQYFERGGPVTVIRDQFAGWRVAKPMTRESVVHAVHAVAQPYTSRRQKDGKVADVDVTLPDRVAALFLDLDGQRGLASLRGVTYAPILSADGTVRSKEGYDATTSLWCADVPDLSTLLPANPTKKEAQASLLKLRKVFATFPFGDAPRRRNAAGLELVDLTAPPGMDESSLLTGLLTAICRPSLDFAPGLLVRAPNINGSGTGKGLLVKIICAIAFGRAPDAFTGGANIKELELRLGAALMEAAPAIFLDNLNGVALRSDLLASVLAEPLASVRVLGMSKMVRLNSSAFLVITGNGLTLTEDLVRRFVLVELDARTEDPEARRFNGNLLAEVQDRRAELLAAALAVWRWARLNQRKVKAGAALGGYAQWCAWVRDALLTLGTADPVTRIADIKAQDAGRQDTAFLFETWHDRHGGNPTRASALHADVKTIIDPHGRGRQHIVAALAKLENTRINSMVLTRCKSAGKWGVATYAVQSALPLFDPPDAGSAEG